MAKKVIAKIFKWATATRLRKSLSSVLIILILFTSMRYLFLKPIEVLAADVYLGLDEGYGTSAAVHDTNNTVTAGSITNAVWKTEDLCQSGKCLYFDGTGDYVSFADNANLDMGSGNTVTLEGWFRTPDITSGTRTLLSKYDSGDADGGYKITMNSSGQIVFGIDGGNSFPSDSVTSTSAYDDNQWHHFAAVKNGSSSITLYIDAISVGTPDNSPAADAANDDTLFIGIDNGSTNGWSGFIDEVKVIRSARSADQVKADYNGSTPSDGSSAGFSSDQNFVSDGLVGYWKLDESTGNPTDLSGNGNTLTNNSTTTFVSGKFANGSEHIPASTQYFSAGSSSVNTYYFDGSDAAATDPNNLWVNDANAFDGSTSTSADVLGFACEGSDISNYLGAQGTNAPASGGTISQVRARIYGNSLFFPSGTGLNASIATDGWAETLGVTGNYNSGASWGSYTVLSAPTGGWTWAKVQALETRIYGENYGGDPACDYLYAYRVEIEVTTSGSASIPVSTVSFWTNPDSDTNYYIALSSGAYITSSAGTLSANGFTNPKYYVNGAETQTITANTWQLVTVTSDTSITADQLYIGRQDANYYDGTLDEVRLYNRKFSPAEIQKLYQWSPGPVGYWNMDENQGGYANDSSGYSHIGTLTNSPKWIQGKRGSAINIPVNTSYVSVDDNTDFDMDYQMTIEAWVRGTADASTNRSIADKGVSGTSEFWFGTSTSNGHVGLMLNPGAADHTDRYYVYGNTNILDSNWHHVAGTYDGSYVRVYVDGKLDVTPSAHTDNIYDGIGTVNIGRTISFGTNFSWVGDIDDVKIYKYARTPAQIAEDMGSSPQGALNSGSALVSYSFDEGSGQTINSNGNGGSEYNATLGANSNASTDDPAWSVNGKFGRALNFDGTSDYANIASTKVLATMNAPFSVSAWTNLTDFSSSSYPVVLTLRSDDTNPWFLIFSNQATFLGVSIGNAANFKSIYTNTPSATLTGSWHHVAVSYNGLGSTTMSNYGIYLDGKLQTNNSGGTYVSHTQSSSIGYLGSNCWKGLIDEVKIYDFPITEDQVKMLYNQGTRAIIVSASTNASDNPSWGSSDEYCPPGQGSNCTPPVAHWKFDENMGTEVTDISGNNLVGTLGNGTTDFQPSWKKGKNGSALFFDGTDDYVNIGNNSILNITGKNITLEAWIKPNTFGESSLGRIIDREDNSTSGYTFLVDNVNVSGGLTFQALGSTIRTSNANAITLGNWQHVAVTYGGANVTFYVNGVNVGSPSFTGNIVSSTNNFVIGRRDADTARQFNGLIDDVKVYNYARTPAQIAWDYNKGGPTGHWQMDETGWNGTVGEVKDNSGNNLHGVRNGDATTITGKFNNGGTFDGTGDYVSLGTPSTLNSELVSISAWVNLTSPANGITAEIYNRTNSSNAGTVALRKQASDNKYLFQIRLNGTESTLRTVSSDNIASSGWHHLAGTYDGTTLKLYVDGVKQSNTLTQTGIIDTDTLNSIDIGRNSGAATYMDGQLDEVRIYNYALTAAQVKTVMNNNSALRFTPITGAP